MQWPTHAVTNQVPDLQDYNIFTTDTVLADAVRREGAAWHEEALTRFGAELGRREVLQLGDLANRRLPELSTHDRFGQRIDYVEFDPSWHELLRLLRREGLHALPWMRLQAGSQVARAAGYFLQSQVEAGALCPTTMTFAAIPLLQQQAPELFARLQAQLFSCEHDPRDLPIEQKKSILIGMGMTEKQGGSDLRSNSTLALPIDGGSGPSNKYALTGHKWFFSAPMSDAHLVLARTNAGPSCFFVPRWRPDGSRNAVLVQRLKDKLGNRSNASSEVEFQDAYGILVGEEGRGIPTMIDMAGYTRLDCVIGSTGLMRRALVLAAHHARHRIAFGRVLAEQPLMSNVLADLALESEAATLLMLRLARAFENPDDPLERAWRRIMTPAAKFWICKRAVEFTGECMEIWGGNGYVENAPMARLYREAPVNSIWEGSGNVMCLDVLRAIEREPEGCALLLADLNHSASGCPELLALVAALRSDLARAPQQRENLARHFAQRLVLAAQSSLMLQHAPQPVADAFITSRTDTSCGWVFGALSGSELQQQEILNRAWPG